MPPGPGCLWFGRWKILNGGEHMDKGQEGCCAGVICERRSPASVSMRRALFVDLEKLIPEHLPPTTARIHRASKELREERRRATLVVRQAAFLDELSPSPARRRFARPYCAARLGRQRRLDHWHRYDRHRLRFPPSILRLAPIPSRRDRIYRMVVTNLFRSLSSIKVEPQ
jgi:hypothetical protein